MKYPVIFLMLLLIPLPISAQTSHVFAYPQTRVQFSGGRPMVLNHTDSFQIPISMNPMDILLLTISVSSQQIIEQLTMSGALKLDSSYTASIAGQQIHEGRSYQFALDFSKALHDNSILTHHDNTNNPNLLDNRTLTLTFSSLTPLTIDVDYFGSVVYPPFFSGTLGTTRYVFHTLLLPSQFTTAIPATGTATTKVYLILPLQLLDFVTNASASNDHVDLTAQYTTTTPLNLIQFSSTAGKISLCDSDTICMRFKITNQYVIPFEIELASPLSSLDITIHDVTVDINPLAGFSTFNYAFSRNQFLALLIILTLTAAYVTVSKAGNRRIRELKNKKDPRVYEHEIRDSEAYTR